MTFKRNRYGRIESTPLKDRRFIIWDTRDGNGSPRQEECGPSRAGFHRGTRIVSDGIIGRIGAENAYLTVYPEYPDHDRPTDLGVQGFITGVEFGLSGSKGTYDVFRVV